MEKCLNEIKVSIIIPVYNIEKYIERCLLSLLNQTLQEIEIICIDDGSTDKSGQIIDDYQEQYPNKIKAVHIENDGVANARNVGIELARGEYVGFVDGDDYVRYDMYESLYNKSQEEQADIVSSAYVSLFEKKSYIIHSGDMQYYGKSVYECPQLLTCDVSFLWNKIFSRSMIENYGLRFEKLRIFEDMLFVDKAFLVANRISKVNEPFYYYRRVRLGSATNVFSKKLFDLFDALEKLFEFYKEHNAFEQFYDMLLFITLNHSFIRNKTVVPYQQEEVIELKLRFLDKSFEFLDKYFPDWKERDYYFTVRNADRECYTSKEYWQEYIRYAAISDLPEELREKAKEIKARGTVTDAKEIADEYVPPAESEKKKYLSELELGILYRKYCKKKKIDEKAILLDSQHGDNLNGNMFYLLKLLMTDSAYSDFTVYLVYRSEKKNSFCEKLAFYNLSPKLVDSRSKDYVKALATSKYLFNDTSFPIFFSKRQQQVYLNTWHGTALKTLGASSKGEIYRIGNLQRNFCNADYILCPNEHMRKVFADDYYLEILGKTKYMYAGYPRNCVFFEKANQRIIDENSLYGKQVIMYMPTWRGSVENVAADDLHNYFVELDRGLTDNQLMFVNLHPYMEDLIDYSEFSHIKPVPSRYEIYDFLNCCDILITDYSSVFFDFAVTGKKIILFTYDREEYLADRGMYFSLDELPFRNAETVSELLDAVNEDYFADNSDFIKQFCEYDCAGNAKEILDFILFSKAFKGSGRVEERPAKVGKNVLVFSGNLYNNLHSDSFYNAISKTENNDNYIITFQSRFLRSNYMALNGLTKDIKTYSLLGKLNYLTPSEEKKLDRAFGDYAYFNRHSKKLLSYIEDEYARLYGHLDIDKIICYGGKSPIILAILSCALCEKVLYIPREGTFNSNLNQNIYKRFDKIFYKHNSVGKKLKLAGNKNAVNISDDKEVFL